MSIKNCYFCKLIFIVHLLLWLQCLNAQPLTDLIAGNKSAEEGASSDKVISADYSQQNDIKMQKRLQRIFSSLDDLKNVKATVTNGIVDLQGEVNSVKAEDRALQFANQLENVIEVKNQIVVNQNLGHRLQESLQKMLSIAIELVAALPLFAVAVAIVVLFWLLGKWMSRKQLFYQRFTDNYFIADILGVITNLVCVILGIIIALTLLDATALIGTFMGAAGIFGLALGFAVKDTVENFITSLLLSLRNPFEIKDFVSIDGHEGTVARLTSRATILISPDNNHIRIPNSLVFKAVIINYTRQPERRFQFDVKVDNKQDLLMLQSLALNSLQNVPGVLTEPKPMAIIHELGDVNVVLRIYAWVNQRTNSLLKVRSEAIRLLKNAFNKADDNIAAPVYNLKAPAKEAPTTSAADAAPLTPAEKNAASESHFHAEDIKNVSADNMAEKQVNKENARNNGQNLLNQNAPKEL